MNHRIISYCYLTLGLALVAGCLYAGALPMAEASAEVDDSVDDGAFHMPASFDPLSDNPIDSSALPAEQVFKNIKILRGVSVRDFMSAMTFMSDALGVRCGFCHVQGDPASDENHHKDIARGMIEMTRKINQEDFGGGESVTCYTCHQGKPMPATVPALASQEWSRLDVAAAKKLKRDSLTTADQVLDRYIQALGGAGAIAKINSAVMEVAEVDGEGATATVEIIKRKPGSLRSTTIPGDPKRRRVAMGYDGRIAWAKAGDWSARNLENEEREQLLRDAEFFPAADLRSSFSSITLLGRERVNDRELYIISASRGNSTDRLYFDATTGLLARRYVEYRTPFGSIPFSIEYGDYREVDGVAVPHTMTWMMAREKWTSRITKVRWNVEAGDAVFARP